MRISGQHPASMQAQRDLVIRTVQESLILLHGQKQLQPQLPIEFVQVSRIVTVHVQHYQQRGLIVRSAPARGSSAI